MDIAFIMSQRYVLLSFFVIVMLTGVFLLIAIWKIRSSLSQPALIIMIVFCLLLIIASMLPIIFIISFGYNS